MTSASSIIDLTATTAKKSKSNFSAVLVYHFLSFLISNTEYGKSVLTQTTKTVPSEKDYLNVTRWTFFQDRKIFH